jgi:hypothetical protein
MQRDPKTGLLLLNHRDTTPIRVKIVTKGAQIGIFDASSGRQIEGVQQIEWKATPQGAQLGILLNPIVAELHLDDVEAVAFQPPCQIVMPNGQHLPVKNGEQMILVGGEKVIGILTFNAADGATPGEPPPQA